MAVTAQYRINGGEVIKISLTGQLFPTRDTSLFGVLTDPTRPDGDEVREQFANGTEGLMRQLGFAKFADVGGNIVRNATAGEIAIFFTAENEDKDVEAAARVASFAETDRLWRKLIFAVLRVIIEEVMENTNVKVNTIIEQIEKHKENMADSATFADFKSETADLPTIVSDLKETVLISQAEVQFKGHVSEDD